MVRLDAVTPRPVRESAKCAHARATSSAVFGERCRRRHNRRPFVQARCTATAVNHWVRDCHTRTGSRPGRAHDRPRWPLAWLIKAAASMRAAMRSPVVGEEIGSVREGLAQVFDLPAGAVDRRFGCAIPSEQLGKLVPLSGGTPNTGVQVGA